MNKQMINERIHVAMNLLEGLAQVVNAVPESIPPSPISQTVTIDQIVGSLSLFEPCPTLADLGYGAFEQMYDSDKSSLIDMLKANFSEAVRYIDKYEPGLAELAKSISKFGLLNPVLLRPVENGYEIVCGQRRVLAICYLKACTIPAVIREMQFEDGVMLSVSEQLTTRRPSPVEEAKALKGLRESDKTLAHLAEGTCIDIHRIRQRLEMLRLPVEELERLHAGEISVSRAQKILKKIDRIRNEIQGT
jgi:ParB/RepB/Spo0J family partition protein